MSKKVILVTGGSGLVGRAMHRIIKEENPTDEEWMFLSSKDADLRDTQSTMNVFDKYKPTHVIHLAAVVGGLYRHLGNNIEMMRLNIRINDNVYEAARQLKCQKVVSCMSTCIFPDETTYPIDETMCYLAQKENKPFVISGSGTPRRQFIFSEDLARLTVWTLREYKEIDPIILSVSEDEEISVKELAIMIAEAFDFKGDIVFDTSKSDGQFKKTTTNKKLRSYLPDYKFKPIKAGIQETVEWFTKNYPNVRKSY